MWSLALQRELQEKAGKAKRKIEIPVIEWLGVSGEPVDSEQMSAVWVLENFRGILGMVKGCGYAQQEQLALAWFLPEAIFAK